MKIILYYISLQLFIVSILALDLFRSMRFAHRHVNLNYAQGFLTMRRTMALIISMGTVW